MEKFNWKNQMENFDQRRDLIIPGDQKETVRFCTEQFLQIGREAIDQKGFFTVALSGGSTPNAIFKALSQPEYANKLDWAKVIVFWSDERSVPPNHEESNYFHAMQAGLSNLPLLPENIFRMQAESHIEENAAKYAQLIRQKVPSQSFDLMMLGMGEDGHTASLFPHTEGLQARNRLVIANYVPQKNTWRMSLTYDCINQAKIICIYVIGASKANMVEKVLLGSFEPDNLPIQKVGTDSHKAIWILDTAAAQDLLKKESQ